MSMNASCNLKWQKLQGHPVLKGRAGHTTTLVGNKLFILGGRNGNLFFDDLWVFDMDLEQWNQLQQKVPFAPRAYHTATLIDDQDLWVIGGSDQSTMFDDVHVLNTTTLQWNSPVIKGSIEVRCRGTHAAVLHPSESRAIMIHGGYGGYGNNDPHWLGDLSLLHTDSLEWNALNPGGTVPCARGYHSLTIAGAYAFLFGGKGDAGIVKEDCLSIYDAMKNKWIIPKVQGDAPLPRSNHAATLMDPDLIIIHGGRHGALRLSDTCILQVPLSSASSISNLHLKWHVLEKTKTSVNTRRSLGKSTLNPESDSPHGRSAHGLVARDRALYLFGGYGGRGLTFNDIFILRNIPSLTGLQQTKLDAPVSSDAQAPICITDNSDEENAQCWRSTKRQKQQSYHGHKSLSGLQEVGHNLKQRLPASHSRNRDAEDTGRIMLKSVDDMRQQSSHVPQVQAVETQEDTVLKTMTKEKDALEKEVINLRQQMESLKANITEKTCIEDGLRADKLHLEKEIASLNERKGDLSKVIRVLEKKVQLSNEKTRDLEYQNQNMKTQIQALRASLDEKEKKNDEVAQEAKDAQNKCEELKVSLDNVRSFSTDVVHERDEYKACVEKIELELEKQMQALQQLNLKFENEKTFLLCEVAERKATADRILTELGMSKESARALQDTIDRQAKQLQDENNKGSVLQKEKEELRHSNAVLVAENKQLFVARESANANFVFLKSELQSTRALYEQNVAEVGRLQKHVEQSKEHIASLHESLKKNEENMQNKDQELSRLRALINEVEQFEQVQMTALQQHLEKLKCVRQSCPL